MAIILQPAQSQTALVVTVPDSGVGLLAQDHTFRQCVRLTYADEVYIEERGHWWEGKLSPSWQLRRDFPQTYRRDSRHLLRLMSVHHRRSDFVLRDVYVPEPVLQAFLKRYGDVVNAASNTLVLEPADTGCKFRLAHCVVGEVNYSIPAGGNMTLTKAMTLIGCGELENVTESQAAG